MKSLELKVKSSNPFAKGSSSYIIEAEIIESDVENFGIDKQFVGKTIGKTPQAWSKVTGVEYNTILARSKAEKKTVAKGKEGRGMRKIVGLDPFERRVGEKAKARAYKESEKVMAVNSFLFGR